MNRQHIAINGNEATIAVPVEWLEKLKLKSGDEIELALHQDSLILRPLNESERQSKIQAATNKVLSEDVGLLQRLAQ